MLRRDLRKRDKERKRDRERVSDLYVTLPDERSGNVTSRSEKHTHTHTHAHTQQSVRTGNCGIYRYTYMCIYRCHVCTCIYVCVSMYVYLCMCIYVCVSMYATITDLKMPCQNRQNYVYMYICQNYVYMYICQNSDIYTYIRTRKW